MDGPRINCSKSHICLRKEMFCLKCDKIGLSTFLLLGSGYITISGLQAEEPAKQMLILRVIRRKIDHTKCKMKFSRYLIKHSTMKTFAGNGAVSSRCSSWCIGTRESSVPYRESNHDSKVIRSSLRNCRLMTGPSLLYMSLDKVKNMWSCTSIFSYAFMACASISIGKGLLLLYISDKTGGGEGGESKQECWSISANIRNRFIPNNTAVLSRWCCSHFSAIDCNLCYSNAERIVRNKYFFV